MAAPEKCSVGNSGPSAVEKSGAGSHLTLPTRREEKAVYAIAFLVFAAASALTLFFNRSMAGGMPMPGNWTMSMMWMPMEGTLVSVAVFAAMWLAMMVAMMLPSALPMLLLYRRVISFRQANRESAAHDRRLGTLWSGSGTATLVLATGYFFVWTLFGVIAYSIGTLIARGAMHWDAFGRSLPIAAGFALCVAGIYQLTPWKSACLAHCRDPLGVVAGHLHTGRFGALKLGIHHGAFCAACCWALMLIQLVLGVMNLGVMILVALVIALEKLLPRGELIARVVGGLAICGGVAIAIRAM